MEEQSQSNKPNLFNLILFIAILLIIVSSLVKNIIDYKNAEMANDKMMEESFDKEESIRNEVEADRMELSILLRGEPKIKKLVLEKDTIFAFVLDDGTSRSGYAQYMCEVIQKYKNANLKYIKILEYKPKSGDSKELGHWICD